MPRSPLFDLFIDSGIKHGKFADRNTHYCKACLEKRIEDVKKRDTERIEEEAYDDESSYGMRVERSEEEYQQIGACFTVFDSNVFPLTLMPQLRTSFCESWEIKWSL
jgi:hypothetical protein